MLEKLFVSKVRIKVLDYFFAHKDEEIHVRGLVRELDEEINAVRRELLNLHGLGILFSEAKVNKLFYRLNLDNPFISDLEQLLYKGSNIGQLFINAITRTGQIDLAFITSNFLLNKYESSQDVDLVIVGNVDMAKLTTEIKQLEQELGRELRITVMRKEDFEYRKKKREPFLFNILPQDKILLIGRQKDLS